MKTEQSNQFNKFERSLKALYNWFVIPESLKTSNPWQSIHVLTRRLRRTVIALLAIAIVGTGITVFIFFFPLRLPAWLPILRLLLLLFLGFILLFIHFQQQGDRFYRQFLEEILNLNNNQQSLVIPRDKRKILKQFEWYSRGRILNINLIALGLASIFVLAPKKVINALNFRKQTVSKKLSENILKQHQQIAYLKTLNVQHKQIIRRLERNTQNNLSHIKRLKSGMHKHYQQIIELRRYLGQINRVRRQIQQLKKIGHAEVWKQERVIN